MSAYKTDWCELSLWMYIFWKLCHLSGIHSSRQSSQRCPGTPVASISWPELFFISLLSCSATFCQGEYCSVGFSWQWASTGFQQNFPRVCSLNPSITIEGGKTLCWNIRDKSLCALPLVFIGYTHIHPNFNANKCTYLLFLHEYVIGTIVLVNTRWYECLYHNIWSLIWHHQDNALFAIVCTTLWLAHLYTISVNTPAHCKHIMTDNWPPASTTQRTLYKGLQVCTKVVVISLISDVIECKQWASHSIHMHCDLIPVVVIVLTICPKNQAYYSIARSMTLNWDPT